MNKYCFVIPVFNHHHKLKALLQALKTYAFPVLIVDDGSHQDCKRVISQLVDENENNYLSTLDTNQGKGAAVLTGLKLAFEKGFTHAIQIDADYQHDTNDVQKFVAQSEKHPEALICGIPIYDNSVPKSRLYPRYITHFWVWIHTLSFKIKDSMCGYRVYPLDSTNKLMNKVEISKRMNFDTDIIVRLSWQGLDIVNVPTKVTYHDDVPSNFRLFKDNVGITFMHTKLFFGMLVRLPLLIKRKIYG